MVPKEASTSLDSSGGNCPDKLDLPQPQEAIHFLQCSICQSRTIVSFDKLPDLPKLYCIDCALDIASLGDALHSKHTPSVNQIIALYNNLYRCVENSEYFTQARDNFSSWLHWLKAFSSKD